MPGEPIGPSCVISCTSTTLPIRRRMWRRSSTGTRRLPGCLQVHQGRVLPGIDELLQTLRQRTDVVVGLLTGNVRPGAGQARLFRPVRSLHPGRLRRSAFRPQRRGPRSARRGSAPCRRPRRPGEHLGCRRYASGRPLCPGDRRKGCRGGHRPAHARGTRRHGGRRAVARPGRSDPSARPMGIIFEVGGAHPAVDLQSPFSLPAFARTPNFHAVKNSAISV